MPMRTTALALSATMLLTGAALAQTRLVEVSDATVVAPFEITADQADELEIYDASGADVGDVEEVLGSDASTATHLQVDFDDDDGGAYADRDDVVVPLDAFTYADGRLTISLDAAAVASLPVRADD